MSSPSYVAAAFGLKGNLAFLALGVALAWVFGSGTMLLSVAGLEVAFLAMMSSNPRFQRLVRARRR